MKMLKTFAILTAIVLFPFISNAQNFKVEENKDSLMYYLKAKSCKSYPDAKVEVLYENCTVQQITPESYSYEFEVAYKVYNASSLGELADIAIPKHEGARIKKLSAITYNLDGENPVESKLEKSDVLMNNMSDGMDIVKFNIPNIKDGSVVKYKFLVLNGLLVTNWFFQREDIPVDYSRFDFNFSKNSIITASINSNIPFEQFTSLKKMYADKKVIAGSATEEQGFGDVLLRSWVRKNIPPFKPEPYMEHENYVMESVTVNYNGFAGEGYYYPIVESWEKYNEKAWYNGIFKTVFDKNNSLKDDVAKIIAGKSDTFEAIKAIYYFVQNKYSINKDAWEPKDLINKNQANSLSINKLLCALYKSAGFNSDLVLVSRRGNDKLNQLLLNATDVTDVFVRVIDKGMMYFVDGSMKDYPFGYLPSYYFNGYSRIVNNEIGNSLELSPVLASNQNNITVTINPNEKSKGVFDVKIKVKYGTYDAIPVRNSWKADSVATRKKIMNNAPDYSKLKGFEVKDVSFDNIHNIDEKLIMNIEAILDLGNEPDVLMMDPNFYRPFTENPLGNKKDRKYDVEFQNISQDKYTLIFKLADGYTMDEMPQTVNLKFGQDGLLSYKHRANFNEATNTIVYNYQLDNQIISLSAVDAFEMQQFYDQILKSFNQKIVIKK